MNKTTHVVFYFSYKKKTQYENVCIKIVFLIIVIIKVINTRGIYDGNN